MEKSKLSKQRIDRILSRYLDSLQVSTDVSTPEIVTQDSNVTLVCTGQWDSAQEHRRKHIVKRILVDFEKRGTAPHQIPVDIF